jgi:hypothetical protein
MKKSQNGKKAVEESRKPTLDEVEKTLGEIIDTIEKYFLVAPFEFIEGMEEETAYPCFPNNPPPTPFNRFYPWADHWMGILFPMAHEAQAKLDARGDGGDEAGELAFAAQRFGFVVGLLVGCKVQGATRQELMEKSRGYTIPFIYNEKRRKEATSKTAG